MTDADDDTAPSSQATSVPSSVRQLRIILGLFLTHLLALCTAPYAPCDMPRLSPRAYRMLMGTCNPMVSPDSRGSGQHDPHRQQPGAVADSKDHYKKTPKNTTPRVVGGGLWVVLVLHARGGAWP